MSTDIDYENPWIYLDRPLMGAMLGTTLVLFISLPISQTNDSTLGESIFGRSEHQKEKTKSKTRI